MATKAQLSARAAESARHLEAVRAFYQTGDEELLRPVFADLRPCLCAFLSSKRIFDEELMNDLVQDSLVLVLAALRKKQWGCGARGKLTSWAIEIAYKEFLHHLRKPRPSDPGSSEDPFLLLGQESSRTADELLASSEEEAKAADLVKAATQAVLALDGNARNAVVLHFYRGLTPTAAAEQMGVHVHRFNARLARGLEALREWGARQSAPTAEVYAALRRVNTGELFREAEPSRKAIREEARSEARREARRQATPEEREAMLEPRRKKDAERKQQQAEKSAGQTSHY